MKVKRGKSTFFVFSFSLGHKGGWLGAFRTLSMKSVLFFRKTAFSKQFSIDHCTVFSQTSQTKAPAATFQDQKHSFFIKKGRLRQRTKTKKTFFFKKRRLRQHSRTRKLFFKTEKQNRFRFRQVGGWVWTLLPRGKIKQ